MGRISPSLLIVVSFLLVIAIGAILLSYPMSSANEIPTDFLDAWFTANSATCVTGLVALDTGTHFSRFGQVVLMLLMQIGGLGYMTISTLVYVTLRRRLFITEKLALREALNIYSTKDAISVLRRIFRVVFVCEGAGALVLFLRWRSELGPGKAVFYGIFHAVSAFNNAGFALAPNFANLTPYATDLIVNLTVTTLIILGGIGFIVIAEAFHRKAFSLHSRLAIVTTLSLIVSGTILFFLLEYSNPQTIASLSPGHKLLASYFQAVTPRTAGFNTVDTGKLLPATLLLTMFLMFVGASPGGTGGGIKTTTFALCLSTIWATLKRFKKTVVFDRVIPDDSVRRSFTIAFLSMAAIAISIFCLSITENSGLMETSFEVFSAFGTVGLSMGITPHLSPLGKIVIIATMFAGRVGALTLLTAFTREHSERRISPPREGISIG